MSVNPNREKWVEPVLHVRKKPIQLSNLQPPKCQALNTV